MYNKLRMKVSLLIFVTILLFFGIYFLLIRGNIIKDSGHRTMYILSTGAPQEEYILPKYNWGECLYNFIDTSKLDIVNMDIDTNFINSPKYIEFVKQLKKNDYVLVQFGNIYNEPNRMSINEIENIKSIYNNCIKDIKKTEAMPVIITPNYVTNNNSKVIKEYYNTFSKISIKWANENDIPVIDLTKMTSDTVEHIKNNFGDQYLNSIYAIRKNDLYKNYKYVLNFCGAVFVSGFVAESLLNVDEMEKYIQKISSDTLPYISRKQFIKQLLEITGDKKLGLENKVFNDIRSEKAYIDYILTAKGMGIVYGSTDGNFYPDRKITIDEACVIADRLLQSKGIVLDKNLANSKLHMLLLYGVNENAMDSVCRFYSVAEKGLNYDVYYLMSIYGIYGIVYENLKNIS